MAGSAACRARLSRYPSTVAGKKTTAVPFLGDTWRFIAGNSVCPPWAQSLRYTKTVTTRWPPFWANRRPSSLLRSNASKCCGGKKMKTKSQHLAHAEIGSLSQRAKPTMKLRGLLYVRAGIAGWAGTSRPVAARSDRSVWTSAPRPLPCNPGGPVVPKNRWRRCGWGKSLPRPFRPPGPVARPRRRPGSENCTRRGSKSCGPKRGAGPRPGSRRRDTPC